MKKTTTLLAIAMMLSALPALANPDKIKAEFEKRQPGTQVKSVLPIGNSGMWEVFNGSTIVYANSDATFFIAGPMIHLANNGNLTQVRLDKLLVTDFAALPASQAFTIKRGNGTRRVALFADPQCGFCKKLEVELEKLEDVSVDVYLTPILGPASIERSKDIACSSSKADAWSAWMVKGDTPAKAGEKCDVNFDKNLALGKSLGIRGVPLLVFADGSRMVGAQSAAEIEKRLAAAGTPQKVATK
jgi:thiol:disulfide interchange protein DsbC